MPLGMQSTKISPAAGLSLATAVPGLAFNKVALVVKAGASAKKAKAIEESAEQSARLAGFANAWRLKPWKDCSLAASKGGIALRYSKN